MRQAAELLARVEIRELQKAAKKQKAPIPDEGRARRLLRGLLCTMRDGSATAMRDFRQLVAVSVYTDGHQKRMGSTALAYERIVGAVGSTCQGAHIGPDPWPVTPEKLLLFAVVKMLGKGFVCGGSTCQAETVRKYISGLRRVSARECPDQLLSDEAYSDVQLLVRALGRRFDMALPVQDAPLDSRALDKLLQVVNWCDAEERKFALIAVWSRAMGARAGEVKKWVGRLDVFEQHPAAPHVMVMRFGNRKWASSGVPMVMPILRNPDGRRCLVRLLDAFVREHRGVSLWVALQTQRHVPLFVVKLPRYVQTLRRWARMAGMPDAEFFQAGSGRAGLATDLVRAGVPPDLVIQLTDHSSVEALEPYVRRSAEERVRAAAVAQAGRAGVFASAPAWVGPPHRRR